MTITWRPATPDGFGVFIAVAGSSRSGKTFTALRLASGIAAGRGEVAAIDTEGGRMSHYARDFKFRVFDMRPPFSPMRFAEAAEDAESKGFAALIIDSFSLEWMGQGGVLDLHEREVTRRAGDDEKKRKRVAQAAWIKPKAAHKAMMTSFLQRRLPIIFCLRAEEKIKPGEDGVPVNLGWQPVQDKRFIYEWTVSWTLHPDTPGMPRYDLPHKIEGQHAHLFPEGQLIGEAAGAGLWQWANSGMSDVFPGDLPSKLSPAEQFVEEMQTSIGKQDSAENVRLLLSHAPVRRRLDRLLETEPKLHQRVLAAAAQRTLELTPQEAA